VAVTTQSNESLRNHEGKEIM